MNLNNLTVINNLLSDLKEVEIKMDKLDRWAKLCTEEKAVFKLSYKLKEENQSNSLCGDLPRHPFGMQVLTQQEFFEQMLGIRSKSKGAVTIKQDSPHIEKENNLKFDVDDVLLLQLLNVVMQKLVADKKDILTRLRKLKVKI